MRLGREFRELERSLEDPGVFFENHAKFLGVLPPPHFKSLSILLGGMLTKDEDVNHAHRQLGGS